MDIAVYILRCLRPRSLLAALVFCAAPAGITPAVAAEKVPMLLSEPPPTSSKRALPKSSIADPTVTRQKSVAINFQYLDSATGQTSPRLGIELFDGTLLTIDIERIERRGPNNYTWFGHVRGHAYGRAILTVVDGQMAGHIVLLDQWLRTTGNFQIQYLGNGLHTLLEIDRHKFPQDEPRGIELKAPGPRALPRQKDAKSAVGADATIDVMVLYSNQVAVAAGAGIGAQIQSAIDATNVIYADSGITPRLRLVHYAQVNYNESGDLGSGSDLDWLTNPVDGVMDEIHALRDTHGADLVSLFVENDSLYCGIAWIGPSANYAFSVLKRSCATGNSSFAHELGHNMGALHDPYVSPGVTPFPYGHGHVNLVSRWRTVMAYNDQCTATSPGTGCARVPFFSNPNLTYAGVPLGTSENGSTATSNNARVVNESADLVANFRAPASATPAVSLSGTSFDFGDQNVGTTGAAKTITVSNSGSGALTLSALTLTGANASEFARSGTCAVGTSLTIGQSCTLQFVFAPSAVGVRAASLGLTTNIGNQTLTLSGNSVSFSLVVHYYQSILRRAPDAAGRVHWESEAARMAALTVDAKEAYRVMAGYFFTGAEYVARSTTNDQYVTDLYQTFFNRAPDLGGLAFWTGQLAAGMPRSVVLYSFLFSPEFSLFMTGIFGNTTSRAEVYPVVDFYRGVLNRLPDTTGFNFWLGRFRSAQCAGTLAIGSVYSAADAMSFQFVASSEYLGRTRTNTEYVGDLYYAFLRRGGDLGGVNFWINRLNTGGVTREGLRQEFLASAEFASRVNAIIMQGCAP